MTDNAKQEEAVTLQHGDFKECMVLNRHICDKKLTDLRKALPFLQAPSGRSAVKPAAPSPKQGAMPLFRRYVSEPIGAATLWS